MAGAIVFKPIIPDKKYNTAAVRAAIDSEINAVANDMLLDYELTTATWKRDVKFVKDINVTRDKQEILVGTDDEIYGYVDEGTRVGKDKYPIPKKIGKPLAFPSQFIPKSQSGHMVSGKGYSGGPFVVVKQVMHPGIKPRKFTKNIQKKWQKLFEKRMDKAMRRAVKASGHVYQ